MSLRLAAREYIWLHDLRHGVGEAEIARRAGVSRNTVRAGIKRARAVDGRPPPPTPTPTTPESGPIDMGRRMVPLFPIGHFTPSSACPHSGPAPPTPFACMCCDATCEDRPR